VQDISLTQSGGTGATDCNIVNNPPCALVQFDVQVGGWDFNTGEYDIVGTIDYTDPPASGSLVVEDCNGNITVVDNFPFAVGPQNFSLTGLNADGNPCDVEVYFTDDPTCSQIFNYTAPVCVPNCPTYDLTSTSPTDACGGQIYYLEIENSSCDGFVQFEVVGNYGGCFGSEITWEIFCNQTSTVIASGGPGTDGANFNVTVGPLDPNVFGNQFNLLIYDSFGDGFNCTGGFIQVEDVNGSIVSGPISGNFGSQANQWFNSTTVVSSSTITVNTPSGPVVSSIGACADHEVGFTLANTNYCTPIQVDLPWEITCDISGTLIASGTHTVIVYPQIPTSSADLVTVTWNTSTCSWDVSPNNDCDSLDVGNIFSISPDPYALSSACADGTEDFTVDYLGFTNGPDCCSTGGPLVPITYVNNQATTDFAPASAYSGINNAALGSVPGSGSGGNATSVDITIGGTGFCYPDQAPLNDDYFVDVYVDGVQIGLYGPFTTANFNIVLTEADLIAAGVTYNENSVVDVYVLPNSLSYGFPFTIYTTYTPGQPCNTLGPGEWSATSLTIDVDATYEQMAPTPANCTFVTTSPYTCCALILPNGDAPADVAVQCPTDVPAVDPGSVTSVVGSQEHIELQMTVTI
jgi:hypothetical protein